MDELSRRFLEESRQRLIDVYLPRLGAAVERLPPEDTWWRPSPGSLAVGTILLHLDGNVRQWILGGLGGGVDDRDRDSEFAAQDGPGAAELLDRLRATLLAAGSVISHLTPERLLERAQIQGREVGVLEAVYHVVEHFGWHTGQAVWISKARAGL